MSSLKKQKSIRLYPQQIDFIENHFYDPAGSFQRSFEKLLLFQMRILEKDRDPDAETKAALGLLSSMAKEFLKNDMMDGFGHLG